MSTVRPAARASIGRRIGWLAALVCLFVAVVTASLLWREWRSYSEAESARSEFEIFRATLIVMEKVSAERGPTNGVLGEELPIPEAAMSALYRARLQSDNAVRRLVDLLQSASCRHCAEELRQVGRAAQELSAARAYIDEFIERPRAERGSAQLDAAIGRMVTIIPRFTPVVDASRVGIVRGRASVLDYLQMARLAAELREQAGLLGSRFTGALGARQPLSLRAQYSIERSLGQVEQLRSLIESGAANSPEAVRRVLVEVRQRYFGDGIAYIAQVREQAGRLPWSAPSTGELAAQYVPLMRPIVDFRDQMLDLAEQELTAHRRMMVVELAGTALGAAVAMALLWLLVGLFRTHVLRPLREAARQIVDISDGRLEHRTPPRIYRGEVQALFEAVRVLQASSVERSRLEAERDRLIEELTAVAETDSLTQLLNRRAFERRAALICSSAAAEADEVFLAVFDIDYFKRVNDNCGHAGGDEALRKVAAICREVWRHGELVARIGGDEFVVLIETRSAEQATASIARFRERLGRTMLACRNGGLMTLTASIGVVRARCADMPDIWTLLARADALLYKAKEGGRDRMEVE